MNRKISTLLTAGLLMAGSLCGSAWAEQFNDFVDETTPAAKVEKDARYLFVQDFGSSIGKYVLGMEVKADGTYGTIVTKWDGNESISDEDLNKYSWAIAEKEYSNISGTTKQYSYAFTNSASVPLRIAKGTNAATLVPVTDPEPKENTYYAEFGFKGFNKYNGSNASSLAVTELVGGNWMFMGLATTNTIMFNASTDPSTYMDYAISFYKIEESEQTADKLNKLYNKKGFNLTAGENVESNLFEDNGRIIAVQVNETTEVDGVKGYKLSEKDANGKDLVIPNGTYFFTNLVLENGAQPAESIKASEVDWLASTVIMVSPTETVETTVNNSEIGQGFKLVTSDVEDLIFKNNTSKFKVGDLPISNACFKVWYDNVSKYSIRLEEFWYQADATATDDKALTKCDKTVGLAVLNFTDGTKHLTTIPENTDFTFSFSNAAIKDGKDLLKTTPTAAVYNIQFVGGNKADEDLFGKYLTSAVKNNASAFSMEAKGLDIADLNTPAFQYTITSVEREAGSEDNADAKYTNVTFTNRETNESFTVQLFKEEAEGEDCYSFAFSKVNGKDITSTQKVTPLTVERNGYAVSQQNDVEFDEYVIVKLIPVQEVNEFAGFYNVADKSVRTIHFARDRYQTSNTWYMGVTEDKDGNPSLKDTKKNDYFVEDIYDAAQFQLVKDTVNVNTIARTFVYYNETTKDVDDVANGDKVSAYTYQLRYVEDGTETDYYLTSDGASSTVTLPTLEENPAKNNKFIIKENADGSVSFMTLTTSLFSKRVVAPAKTKIAIDAEMDGDDYLKYAINDTVYAGISVDQNIKTYLEDKVPFLSWEGESHVTLLNNTLGVSGDYISLNEANEGIVVSGDAHTFFLYETDKENIVPSFYIMSEGKLMFNPVDSVFYQEDMEIDPDYQLGKSMTKAIFKAGTVNDARSEITTMIKGEERVLAEKADNVSKWAGLDRFKFQIIESGDGDDTYNIRQASAIKVEENKQTVWKTGYLASLNDKIYFTNDKALAMDITIETTSAPTSNESIADEAVEGVKVIAGNGQIEIQGAAGKMVVVSNILGKVVANTTLTSDNQTITVPAGIVVVAVEGEDAVKAVVR